MRSDVSVLLFLQDDAVVKNNSIFVHVPLHTVLVHEARGEGEGGGGEVTFSQTISDKFAYQCFPKSHKDDFQMENEWFFKGTYML